MHLKAAALMVESVRRRERQGDHPTEPALSVEKLEDLVVTLADQLAAARHGAGETEDAHSLREAAGCAFDAINISGASEETAREACNILGPALTVYDLAARAAHPEEPQHG